MALDPNELRACFGRFATGVTVVTCAGDAGRPHGATVNAFTAVSLDPALCQVTLTRSSRAARYLDGAPFTVNILAADQLGVAVHFAGRPRETEPVWAPGAAAPVLAGTAATISCAPWRRYDGGDHLLVLGEVTGITVTDRPAAAAVLRWTVPPARRAFTRFAVAGFARLPVQRLVPAGDDLHTAAAFRAARGLTRTSHSKKVHG